ncbi:MAG: ANTAR domain-containing protein [Actinomycetota bacterium]|nr:ANTAR domain-containing protein [Actinomycetota bacterium]
MPTGPQSGSSRPKSWPDGFTSVNDIQWGPISGGQAHDGSLRAPLTIEKAKGVLSEIERIDADEAFARLRSYAHKHDTELTDIAAAVGIRALPETAMDDLARVC